MQVRCRVCHHVTLTSAGVGPCKPPQGTPARVAGRNQLEERNPNRTENVGNETHDFFSCMACTTRLLVHKIQSCIVQEFGDGM